MLCRNREATYSDRQEHDQRVVADIMAIRNIRKSLYFKTDERKRYDQYTKEVGNDLVFEFSNMAQGSEAAMQTLYPEDTIRELDLSPAEPKVEKRGSYVAILTAMTTYLAFHVFGKAHLSTKE